MNYLLQNLKWVVCRAYFLSLHLQSHEIWAPHYFSHWILAHLQTANSKLEETQKVEKQERMKLVKENEKNILELATLRQELDIVGMMHKFCSLEMEAEAKAAIAVLQLRIKEHECLLADSNNKVKELEASFKSKCHGWTMKEKIYQSFIDFQFEAMQVYIGFCHNFIFEICSPT